MWWREDRALVWDSEHEGGGTPHPEPEHTPPAPPEPVVVVPEPEDTRPVETHDLAPVLGVLSQIHETLGGLKSETEAQNARLQTIIEQHQAHVERQVRGGHGLRGRR